MMENEAYNQRAPIAHTINVTKDGLFVDGTLVSPSEEKRYKNYKVIWDTAGRNTEIYGQLC
ncbi:MAG: hypothetical protein LBU99_00465 [Spirochaetaceae bacterium]|jgi:hypothetical protein|nr:hypothetical protein [Spirochaetaceae bacterium]